VYTGSLDLLTQKNTVSVFADSLKNFLDQIKLKGQHKIQELIIDNEQKFNNI